MEASGFRFLTQGQLLDLDAMAKGRYLAAASQELATSQENIREQLFLLVSQLANSTKAGSL